MKTHDREILIYYNPKSSAGRKTVAHAQGMTKHLRTFSFEKSSSTTTSWQLILDALDLHPKEIMNKANPYYQENIRGKEFDEESLLNIISQNPSLIKAPIAMRGRKAILCTNPTDIYKL